MLDAELAGLRRLLAAADWDHFLIVSDADGLLRAPHSCRPCRAQRKGGREAAVTWIPVPELTADVPA